MNCRMTKNPMNWRLETVAHMPSKFWFLWPIDIWNSIRVNWKWEMKIVLKKHSTKNMLAWKSFNGVFPLETCRPPNHIYNVHGPLQYRIQYETVSGSANRKWENVHLFVWIGKDMESGDEMWTGFWSDFFFSVAPSTLSNKAELLNGIVMTYCFRMGTSWNAILSQFRLFRWKNIKINAHLVST